STLFPYTTLFRSRPINNAHVISRPPSTGVNGVARTNVHTIALQLPIAAVSKNGDVPTTVDSKASVIGVYASASRRQVRVLVPEESREVQAGEWGQVSRLGIPF